MWRILLGGEKQGEWETLASAIKLARNLARVHNRPAWLLDETGYPVHSPSTTAAPSPSTAVSMVDSGGVVSTGPSTSLSTQTSLNDGNGSDPVPRKIVIRLVAVS